MKIKVEILTKSPMLISEESSRLWNKSQKRDNKTAYIPGSALKGALRETADTLKNYKNIVDDLFGEEGKKQGKLQFSKLICENPTYIEKTHVVMSRKTKANSYNKLFNTNALDKENKLVGFIYHDQELGEEEKKLLKGLTNLVKKIGGMKSAGYGRVDISFSFATDEKNNSFNNDEIKDSYALLVLEPIEPFLTIKERSKNYMFKSSKIIPGETIRGAYAKKIEQKKNFDKIIFNEEVKFPAVIPSKEGRLTTPIPATTMKKKYKDIAEGIFDLTIPKMKENEINKDQIKISLEDSSPNGERLENAGGYFDFYENRILSIESETKQFTQTSVSRKTRGTKAGELRSYVTEYFNSLVGIIKSSNPEYLKQLSQITDISVGNSKTRGFGKMKSRIIPIKNLKDDFKNNIKTFSDLVKENILTEKTNKIFVPILLTSDLIIPANRNFDDLFEGFKVNQKIYRKDKFTSWNIGTNNVKTFYETIKAGSAIILETEDDDYLDKIWELFLTGIGHRTGSGFGNFLVVDFSKIN
jgi:CRISPR/Cas system CSM-associated protein Csm3 (group 7 of RAMP superfamily)